MMRTLSLNLALSLDGLIEGPNGEFDWCFNDQDYGMTEFVARTDTIVMGRGSYDTLMTMGVDYFPDHRKLVCSRTLDTVAAPYELLPGDAVEAVARLKEIPGKDIWLFGGASLTADLMNAGLVDELMLAVHPLLLGAGKPLFSGLKGRMPFTLLRAEPFSSGLVQLVYGR